MGTQSTWAVGSCCSMLLYATLLLFLLGANDANRVRIQRSRPDFSIESAKEPIPGADYAGPLEGGFDPYKFKPSDPPLWAMASIESRESIDDTSSTYSIWSSSSSYQDYMNLPGKRARSAVNRRLYLVETKD